MSPYPAPRQIEIIRIAAAKTTVGEWMPADMLHDLRFNKNSSVGLEPLWQKANHLVTTQGVLTTQAGTLNFVFSDDDERDEQWRAFMGWFLRCSSTRRKCLMPPWLHSPVARSQAILRSLCEHSPE